MNIKERLIDFTKNYCTTTSIPGKRDWDYVTLENDVLTLDFKGLSTFIIVKNGSKQLAVYLYIVAYALSFTYNVKIHLVSHTINTMYDPIDEFKDSPLVYDLTRKLMKELTAIFSVMNDTEGFGIFLSKVNKEVIDLSIDTLLQTAEDFGCIEIKAMLMRYTNNNSEDGISL